MIEQKKEITCIAYLGKLYVTKDFLMNYFGVSDRTITNWIKKGLTPIKDKNFSNKNLFILKEVEEWVEEWKEKNISQIKSDNAKGKDTEVNIKDKDMNSLFEQYKNGTADEKRRLLLKEPQLIESINKIEDIIKKEALNKDFDTRYVLKDKVKKGQQEMASMFVSFLKTAMPVLSKDLQHKSQEEIYHELDRYFEKEIKHLLTYVSKEEEEIVTYYELTTLMTKIIANNEKTSQEIKEYFENLIEGK